MTKTKLQIMREKKGLTVEQLVDKMFEEDVSKNVNFYLKIRLINKKLINLLENKVDPELGEHLIKHSYEEFAQALGCSVDELVEE
ncbi:MAG TPA: hypothetical protein DIW25_09110 [Lactococcus garvieae]|uniref:XRE family transcriptional regulator n=1 Tax=Lactococcus garvieae TaxID=1363 RepID=UPI000EC6632C|nr:XRE family transcriptional regulator [Lactococcus garvieae]HCS86713.1 hypothetical protein [Lactococcus garvieae]